MRKTTETIIHDATESPTWDISNQNIWIEEFPMFRFPWPHDEPVARNIKQIATDLDQQIRTTIWKVIDNENRLHKRSSS
jgi:hypothetical protein